MLNIFDYAKLFEQEIIKEYMRPMDSPYILFGPLIQPVRGFLFAIGIWPIRLFIFNKKYGWFVLWNIIIVFGILSTPAAAPCSIEGLIYSKLPLWYHLIGLPEILLQSLAFSSLLFLWVKKKPNHKVIEQNQLKKKSSFFVMAVVIACFAYIGYAIGAILSAKLSGVAINIKDASSNLKIESQLMFIVAFGINVILIIVLSKIWIKNKVNIFQLFFIFWFIDTAVPLIYQSLFMRMMPIHLGLILGFFPSLIIVLSFFFNRRRIIEMKL